MLDEQRKSRNDHHTQAEADVPLSQSFGAHIRQARIKCDLTQEEVAIKLDLTQTQISQVERGRHQWVNLRVLQRLATVLHVNLNDALSVGEEA